MGTEEENPSSKSSKAATSSSQEAPSTPSFPDWSSSMQAYYGAGVAPPFFASAVASPTPHPYMWAGQHPFMPPYGTAVPYPALYPAGGVYAHPHVAMTPNAVQGNTETEVKMGAVNDGGSTKKSKGNSGSDASKGGRNGNAASGSGNDDASESAESDSDGSLDGSDDNNQQEPASSKKGSFGLVLADGANAQNRAIVQASVTGKAIVSMPGTNLNIGRENGAPDHQWNLDERELKRQKRKQSNRESARRSRLRKQAECEELQRRVEALNSENHSLRDELQRLKEECDEIESENKSIKDELTQLCGADITDQEHRNPTPEYASQPQGIVDDS